MVKSMSPSITAGQIAKFLDLQTAALRKSGLPSEETQQVLESQGRVLADEFVAAVRKRVEAGSKMIVLHVKVDRIRTPQQVLAATGRRQYVNDDIVSVMPRGDTDEGDIHFFHPSPDACVNGVLSDEALKREFDRHGLKPVDPYKLAQANADNPAFADSHPNATHWKDTEGKWCYATFASWRGERGVSVDRSVNAWLDYWWFAGLRK